MSNTESTSAARIGGACSDDAHVLRGPATREISARATHEVAVSQRRLTAALALLERWLRERDAAPSLRHTRVATQLETPLVHSAGVVPMGHYLLHELRADTDGVGAPAFTSLDLDTELPQATPLARDLLIRAFGIARIEGAHLVVLVDADAPSSVRAVRLYEPARRPPADTRPHSVRRNSAVAGRPSAPVTVFEGPNADDIDALLAAAVAAPREMFGEYLRATWFGPLAHAFMLVAERTWVDAETRRICEQLRRYVERTIEHGLRERTAAEPAVRTENPGMVSAAVFPAARALLFRHCGNPELERAVERLVAPWMQATDA